MAKYIIRDAHQDDLPGIVRLRNSIKEFRAIETEEYVSFWNSLIKINPCSIQQVLVAVSEKNEIIAHYAMVPFRFLNDGKPLVGGFLCQLMVQEEYRKELIFPRMELKFLKDYKPLGYDFAFSLGNREKVVKAHLSFGFKKLGELPVYAKPYKLAKIAHSRVKSRVLKSFMMPVLFTAEKILQLLRSSSNGRFEISEVSCFGRDIDDFTSQVQSSLHYSALRDSTILNWRFASSSSIKYQILLAKEEGKIIGYAVLRRMQMNRFDVLAVVDILFPPDRPDAGKALLNTVHKIATEMHVEMSACLLNSHDPLSPVLKKCGYIKTPETFSLFVHEPKNTKPYFNKSSFNKWHLTWFDNDAV